MTRRAITVCIVSLVGLALAAGLVVFVRWQREALTYLRGAVIVQDSDPRKQLPIAGVDISAADDLAPSPATSDASGFFLLKLRGRIRKGHALVLHFQHPQYLPLDLRDTVSNHLYVVRLTPVPGKSVVENQPRVNVTDVRVRYTINSMTELNVGSAVKTFEVQNKGNVPCKGQHPCSPDGKWKAAIGGASLDAGAGNEFRDVRASCIAGPCPFTRIEGDLPRGGRTIQVSARDWSDTATFLVEAEVFHPMVSPIEYWSYPVVVGEGLSFSLPPAAESVSIEAELDRQTIIFPLGPALFLSWAACETGGDPDKARIYRCAPKPGYRFE